MSSTPARPLAYSIAEAANLIGIGRTMAYALVSDGELSSITIGTRRLVTHEALVDFIDRRVQAAS